MHLEHTESGLFAPLTQVSPEEPLDVPGLTRRMKQGDETAYRTFYDAYYHRLWRYLLVVTAGDEEATAEALQSTLIRVVRYVKIFSAEESFWGWLTVLARSALSDQRRGRNRYMAFLGRFTRHSEIQQGPLLHDTAPDARLRSLLENNLAALSTEERALVEAKYFDGQSVAEIAHDLGVSESAIESRLVRVRSKLKAALMKGLKE